MPLLYRFSGRAYDTQGPICSLFLYYQFYHSSNIFFAVRNKKSNIPNTSQPCSITQGKRYQNCCSP